MKILKTAALLLVCLATTARAEIRAQTVEYRDGETILEGFLAFDDASSNLRPGVLIAPEWWGLTDYPKHRAEQLARMGYVAFAIDMYGKGATTDDPAEAGKLMTPIKNDRKLMRRRAQAGLDTLMDQKYVDKNKLAAIGYCFGGTTVLEMARDGSPLAGVICFHGDLGRTDNEGPDKIHAKVLVCHGADDPHAPLKTVDPFEEEMKLAKADFQVNVYSGAMHAFTNPDADRHHIPGIAYNEEADRRSWMALTDFFAEIFR